MRSTGAARAVVGLGARRKMSLAGYAPSMRIVTVLGALLFVACSKKEPPADESTGSQTFSPPVKLLHVSFAHFDKDHVVECSDVTTTASLEDVEKTFADERKINQPCAAAFASRVTLAICTVNVHTDAGASMLLSVAHYDFAAVALSDRNKSDCLSKGGNWNPLKRESTAFQKAKLEYDQRNARDATD